MAISHRDQADLSWFLSTGTTEFWRSPSGNMLERAEMFGYDSSGARIPIYDRHTCMNIKKERVEPSYTPALEHLTRFAVISRQLRVLESIDPRSVMVMELYYGDSGSRWGLQSPMGRIFSIYHLTATGQRFCKELREKHGTSELVHDDEILATEWDLQKRQPNNARLKKMHRIGDEADELIITAYKNWNAACRQVAAQRVNRSGLVVHRSQTL